MSLAHPTAEPSDEELVARVAAGDRRAYGMLVERHLDRTVTVAQRVLSNRAEAEDVAQEAFLKLWQGADRFRPGGARFSTWFYRVTMNLCLDRKRRPGAAPLDESVDPADTRPDPGEVLEQHRFAGALAHAVADLPERQRAAISLTYDAGLSNAEAAKALDVSVKSLETLLVRAKRGLRDRLAGWRGGSTTDGGQP